MAAWLANRWCDASSRSRKGRARSRASGYTRFLCHCPGCRIRRWPGGSPHSVRSGCRESRIGRWNLRLAFGGHGGSTVARAQFTSLARDENERLPTRQFPKRPEATRQRVSARDTDSRIHAGVVHVSCPHRFLSDTLRYGQISAGTAGFRLRKDWRMTNRENVKPRGTTGHPLPQFLPLSSTGASS